jgi:hypothetical protein
VGSTRDCSFMDRELVTQNGMRSATPWCGPVAGPCVAAVARTGRAPCAHRGPASGGLCPSHVRCAARRTRSESTAVPVPLSVTTPAGRSGPSRRSKTPHLDDSEPGILEAKLGIRVQDAGHHPHCISPLAFEGVHKGAARRESRRDSRPRLEH